MFDKIVSFVPVKKDVHIELSWMLICCQSQQLWLHSITLYYQPYICSYVCVLHMWSWDPGRVSDTFNPHLHTYVHYMHICICYHVHAHIGDTGSAWVPCLVQLVAERSIATHTCTVQCIRTYVLMSQKQYNACHVQAKLNWMNEWITLLAWSSVLEVALTSCMCVSGNTTVNSQKYV